MTCTAIVQRQGSENINLTLCRCEGEKHNIIEQTNKRLWLRNKKMKLREEGNQNEAILWWKKKNNNTTTWNLNVDCTSLYWERLVQSKVILKWQILSLKI